MDLSKILKIRSHLRIRGSNLFIRNISLKKLSEEYGTPLYVIDAERIIDKYKEIYNSLSKHFKEFNIAYSYKANHSLSVVNLLSKLEAGATVTSYLGMELALSSGVSPSNVVLVGPSKTKEELRYAIQNNIGLTVVESYEELLSVDSIANELGLVANVGIRVNLNIKSNTHKKIATGLLTHKFGVNVNELHLLLKKCKKLNNVNLVALHSHIGSQILDLNPLKRQAIELTKLYIKSIENYNLKLNTLDFGGGVGVPYLIRKSYITYEDYAKVISTEMKALLKNKNLEEPKIIVEPGRYIVADSSILLTKVSYVKKLGNKKWLLVDAGMNDFMRVALYDAYHEILPVEKLDRKFVEKYNIGGPVCESSDVFAFNRMLPSMKSGELLAMLDVGAYGLSMANNYNIRSIPKTVMVWKDKVEVAREKESLEDIVKKEKVPNFIKELQLVSP
ncbi:MAG: diaminopimelate decarboxylase [Candidatus Micrarchaeia archaeon]